MTEYSEIRMKSNPGLNMVGLLKLIQAECRDGRHQKWLDAAEGIAPGMPFEIYKSLIMGEIEDAWTVDGEDVLIDVSKIPN